jgi:hypothetical protein
LGSVVGLSFCSTIVQQYLRTTLRTALHDNKDVDKIVEGVRQSLDYLKTLDPQIRALVRDCYGRSTGVGFASLVILMFLTLLSSFFIREQKLSR